MRRGAIAADHRGAHVIDRIVRVLKMHGAQIEHMGTCDGSLCDYPDQAYPVARAVADGDADMGVLMCGTGIGMEITANKLPGVRAAQVHDEISAEMARRHNDANIICLSADLLGPRMIERLIEVWMTSDFEGGRHARRIAKISAIERGEDPRALDETASAAG